MLLENETSLSKKLKTHPRQLGIPYTQWGRNLIAACPFHAPEENSMFFYDSLGYWRYRCLQCGSEGNLIEFVMRNRFNGLDEKEARLQAYDFFGAQETKAPDELQNEHPWIKEMGGEKSKVLELFVSYCHWAAYKSKSLSDFLESRGWSIAQAQLYGLGYYSGDFEPFVSYCALSGIERHQISCHLDNLEASCEARVTIPARNAKGIIHAVYGRSLEANPSEPYISYASGPLDIPFNMQSRNEHPIIVEGFFDTLTADLAGISGVVSTIYQEFNKSHLYKLKACGAESITVVLRRTKNRKEQAFLIQSYLKLATSLNLKFKSILLPEGQNLDELLREKGADYFIDLLQNTQEDTIHTHRRSVMLQDIKENFDVSMFCSPDTPVGYSLTQFSKLSMALDGVQPGLFFVSSQPMSLSSIFLINLALDLVITNTELKVIYINLKNPRRIIFDQIISLLTGESILEIRKQSECEEANQKRLEATKKLLHFVKENRLEIWEDHLSFENIEMLQTLKEMLKESPDLILIIDGIDQLRVSNRSEIFDIHERRSTVLLDIYKSLDIPVFLGGNHQVNTPSLLESNPYIKDSEANYRIEAKEDELFLTVDSKNLAKKIYHGTIQLDSTSLLMKES